MNNASTTKDKRATLRQVGEAETDMLLPKPHPRSNDPQSGGISKNMELLPERQGVCAPHQAPQPVGPAPERQGLKT